MMEEGALDHDLSWQQKTISMWLLILLLGISSLHWTTAIVVLRGTYTLNITDKFRRHNILVEAKCMSYRVNSAKFCMADPTLDLSGLKFKAIARHAFDRLSYVGNCNVENNDIKTFPSRLFLKMIDLESLSLANNKIRRLHVNFGGLNKLKRIDLSNNEIKSLINLHRLNIKKSAEIIMEGNGLKFIRIKQDDGESLPPPMIPGFSVESWGEGFSLPSTLITLETALTSGRATSAWDQENPSPYHANVCQTDSGIMESVSLSAEKRSFDNCRSVYVGAVPNILNLNYRGLTAFRRGWYRIQSNYFSTISLARHRLHEITPELLNDLPESIIRVSLVHNLIGKIEKNVIDNKSLKSLWLDKNHIAEIEDGAFERTSLHELSMGENWLENLDFARTLPISVKQLWIFSNQISRISDDSLINLKELEYLNLRGNYLTHLSVGIFRGLDKLKKLDLSLNKVRTIEPGTFHQENLSHLDLSFNNIVELNPGIFKDLRKMSILHLFYNKIEKITSNTFSGMKNSVITRIHLESNNIHTIEKGSFARMTIHTLRLDQNSLAENSIEAGAFESCTLAKLHLDENFFTSINGDSFFGILVYNELSLANNTITTIRQGDTKYMGCPLTMRLTGNEVERIENGAFYEFRKCQNVTIRFDGVRVIQAGAFDDVWS